MPGKPVFTINVCTRNLHCCHVAHRSSMPPVSGFLDHYLLGAGSRGGWRTRQTDFGQCLEHAGYAAWATLEKFWQSRDVLAGVLGPERVLISREGVNALGKTPAEGPAEP